MTKTVFVGSWKTQCWRVQNKVLPHSNLVNYSAMLVKHGTGQDRLLCLDHPGRSKEYDTTWKVSGEVKD